MENPSLALCEGGDCQGIPGITIDNMGSFRCGRENNGPYVQTPLNRSANFVVLKSGRARAKNRVARAGGYP